jgi:hypothetical protein
MEVSPAFERPDDEPIVSPNLQRDCEKWHTGLQSVRVARKAHGGEEKLCEIRMRNAEDGEPPDDDIDDIVEMIMHAVQVLGYEETGEESQYRVQWRVRGKDGSTRRKHTSFDYPISNGLGVRDRDAPTDLSRLYAMERQQMNHVITVLVTYNENLTARLIEMARNSSGQFEPLLKVIDTLVSKYDEGLRMQATALKEMLQSKFDTKTAELEAENTGKMWDTLRQPLKVAAAQFGTKLSDVLDLDDDADDDDDDDDFDDDDFDDDDDDADDDDDLETDDAHDDLPAADAQPGKPETDEGADVKKPASKKRTKQASKSKSAKRTSSQPAKKPERKNVKVDPNKRVVGAIDGLLNSVTAEQWFALQNTMSKAQYAKLREAHGSDHDDQASQCIMDLQRLLFQNIPRAKKIRAVFTSDQFDALEKLGALAEKHLEDSGK